MASTFPFLLTFLTIFSVINISESEQIHAPFSKPNALILPVLKDNSTNLHIAHLHKRTPLQSTPFLIDLNNRFLWENCDQNYLSSTYRAPFCHSTQCALAGRHGCRKCLSTARPGCHNNTCSVTITNPAAGEESEGEIGQDFLAIQSVDQSIPGPLAVIPRFLFACASSTSKIFGKIQGIAGLGHSHMALPTQFASNFGFPPIFAMCLSSIPNKYGVVFFGNTSYMLHPGIDFSRNLIYTPLTISSLGQYSIPVSSITIHNNPVPLNASLFSRNREFIDAIVSTTDKYSILESSLFRAFAQIFTAEMLRASRRTVKVNPVAPFEVCFANLSIVPRTEVWAPVVHLGLQNEDVRWSILSPNSMVEVEGGVRCLAFVDGGSNPVAPITIGAHQMEDNVLEFDLEQSRLGFRYSLRFSRHSCSSFEFNPTP